MFCSVFNTAVCVVFVSLIWLMYSAISFETMGYIVVSIFCVKVGERSLSACQPVIK